MPLNNGMLITKQLDCLFIQEVSTIITTNGTTILKQNFTHDNYDIYIYIYIQGVRKVTIQSYKLLYSFIVLYVIVFVTI